MRVLLDAVRRTHGHETLPRPDVQVQRGEALRHPVTATALTGRSDLALGTVGTETDRHDKTAKLREMLGLKLLETQHLRIARPATVRWVEFFMGQHFAEFNGDLVHAFLRANRGWGYCAWTCYRGRNDSGITSGLHGGPA